MLIGATTGHENFQSGSAKSYLFVTPTRRFPGKEMHIGVAAKAQGAIRQTGSPQTVPAAPGMRPEMGRWTTCNYDVPEGTLLKLFAVRSGGFGSMRVQGSLFLMVREHAAFRRVQTILTGHPKAAYSRVNIEGRFDLLTVDQAVALGAVVPNHFRTSFEEGMVRRAFEIIEIDREVAAPPINHVEVVENSQGEAVEVVRRRRGRALDL
jgi:hypothetical protein